MHPGIYIPRLAPPVKKETIRLFPIPTARLLDDCIVTWQRFCYTIAKDKVSVYGISEGQAKNVLDDDGMIN